eukprot:323728_1
MSLLSNVKQADKRSKYTVFGYIREMESNFNLENIPMLISYLCLSYHYDPEYISKARDDAFEISKNRLIITSKKTICFRDHTIYCNQWIHSMSNVIAKWTFKINYVPNASSIDGIYFGLASEQNDNGIYNDFSNSKAANYAVSDCGDKYTHDAESITENVGELHSNDEVTYTLDLQNATFGCKINNNNELILFEYIKQSNDIKYKMVIQIAGKGGSVTLKNFTTTYK